MPFSFAYLSLAVGTGSPALFGAVQVTMLVAGFRQGERFGRLEWAGFGAAVVGLVYLALPGWSAPDPVGLVLMAAAGVAWAVDSLRGRHARDAVAATAGNFLRAAPLAGLVVLLRLGSLHASPLGVGLAVASGAAASGLGYVLWYAALEGLTASRAATVQLSVPVLAAVAGIVLLGEPLTLRLVIAGLLILGGVAVNFSARRRQRLRPRTAAVVTE